MIYVCRWRSSMKRVINSIRESFRLLLNLCSGEGALFGINKFIKLENGVEYAIADETLLNGNEYLLLINSSDIYDYCISSTT
jgi:hypothetical protein